MQAFVLKLTADLLFLHTVFGCCWHHSNCCAHGSTVAQRAKCCHHQHGGDSKQQDKPGECKVECEGTCIYVAPQKIKVAAPQLISFDAPAVSSLLADHG